MCMPPRFGSDGTGLNSYAGVQLVRVQRRGSNGHPFQARPMSDLGQFGFAPRAGREVVPETPESEQPKVRQLHLVKTEEKK